MTSRNRKYDINVAATYYEGKNSWEGRLKLNSEYLVFLAKSKQERLKKIEILISEIIEVVKKNSLGIIPNVLIVKTCNNSYTFHVYSREQVIKYIENVRNKAL
ncbi:MAG: hypothetical protein N3A01_04825 [Bacteroidales bacterium]|nr:hypothetical protein [Bacteroidales bacterium]